MVEGHCAKRYADDARQKCVGKRVVEIIWRADPQNQKNVEGVVRGRRLVAVECISKQVFLRFADDAAAPRDAQPVGDLDDTAGGDEPLPAAITPEAGPNTIAKGAGPSSQKKSGARSIR